MCDKFIEGFMECFTTILYALGLVAMIVIPGFIGFCCSPAGFALYIVTIPILWGMIKAVFY